MDFNILVGTMTGTAELVAEIDIFLNDSGQKDITLIDNFNHDELENINNLVIAHLPMVREMPDGSQSFA